MSNLFTEEMRIRLEQLEYEEENRKAKARLATKKWREENAEKVAQQRAKVKQDRVDLLAELKRLRALHEAPPKQQPHDASMEQML